MIIQNKSTFTPSRARGFLNKLNSIIGIKTLVKTLAEIDSDAVPSYEDVKSPAPLIIPSEINEDLLNKLGIDSGMRTLMVDLIKKGYDTRFSCEGHGHSLPYLSFTKGSGNGSFERRAQSLGMKLRERKPCCEKTNKPFCPRCGCGNYYIT